MAIQAFSLSGVLSLDLTQALSGVASIQSQLQALTSQPVNIVVNLQGAGAVAGLTANLGNAQAAANAAAGAMNNVATATNGAATATRSFNGGILQIAKSLLVYRGLSMAIEGVTGAIKDGIGYNATLQTNLISTTNLMHGNAKAAKELQGWMQDFAATTPFQFKNLLPLEQQLLAAGQSVKTLKSELQGMGDAAAALRPNDFQEAIGHLSLSFAQASATGRITGETMREMRHVGVPAIQYLADAWGVSTQQMQNDITKKMIPAKDGLAAITIGMERQFHGQMDKMRTTAIGAWSNIKDAADKLLGGATAKLFGSLSDIANKINNVASNKDFQKWLGEVGDRLKDMGARIFPYVEAGIALLGARFLWLGGVAIVSAIRTGIAAIATFVTASQTGFLLAIAPITSLAVNVALFALAYKTNFLHIKDLTDWVVNHIVDGLKTMVYGAASAIDWLTSHSGGLSASTHYADGVVKWFDNIDTAAAAGKAKLQQTFSFENMGNIAKKAMGSAFGSVLDMTPFAGSDFSKWSQQAKTAMGAMPKTPNFKGDFLPPDPEKAAKAAAAALKKLNLDQLKDAQQMWDGIAKAAEDSAKRQIDALTGIRDSLRDLFSGFQETLLKQGIINNPMGAQINALSAKLGIGQQATAINTNMHNVVDFANGRANAAASRRSEIEGGTGFVPKYALKNADTSAIGMRVAESAMRLQSSGAAADFVHQCQSLARTTMQTVSHAYDKYFGGSALISMHRFQAAGVGGRYQPGMNLPAGSLLYSDTMGHGNGHVQTIGMDGQRLDQHGRNKFRESNFEWFVPPPGVRNVAASSPSSTRNASQNSGEVGGDLRAMYGKKAVDVSWLQNSGVMNSAPAFSFSNDLTKYGKVPQAWGAAVKETDTTTNRFSAQMLLAQKSFSSFLDAMSPDKSKRVVETIRAIANQTDYLLSREKNHDEYLKNRAKNQEDYTKKFLEAAKSARKEISQLDKSNPLRSKGDEAIGALNERMQKGGDLAMLAATPGGKKIVNTLYDDTRRNAYAAETKLVRDLNTDLSNRTSLLQLEARMLQSGTLSDSARSTALEVEKYRREELKKLTESHVRDASSVAQAAANQYALNLQLERTNTLTAEHQNRMRIASDAMAGAGYENGLAQKGFFGARLDELTSTHSATMTRYLELTRQGVSDTKALAMAQSEAFAARDVTRMQQTNALLREYSQLVRDTNASGALESTKQGIFSTTLAGSPDQSRALAMATERARLQSQYQSGAFKWTEDLGYNAPIRHDGYEQVQKRLDLFGKSFDAQAQTTSMSEYNKIMSESVTKWRELADGTALGALKFRLANGDLKNLSQTLKDGLIKNARKDEILGYFTQLKDGVRGILSGMFTGLEEHGFKGFFTGIQSGVTQMLNNLASQILTSWAMNALTGLLTPKSASATPAQQSGASGFFQSAAGLLGNLFGGGSSVAANGSHANGLDRVPFDGYRALVHKDEAILTARQAQSWRAQMRDSAIGNSGTSPQSSGGHTFHITVNGVRDAQNVPRAIEQHAAGMGVSRGDLMRGVRNAFS